MSRDGSGNYVLVSGNPVVTNTVISSTWANATLSDIGAALTQSLSKDGQTTPTANLTMGNFRLTALANAAARTDAITAGQVQDNALTVLSSVSGTDTITASSSPAIVAYATGSRFQFVSAGANTTTTPTLNINGLGAKNIKKVGAISLLIGDIASGQMVDVIYDGTQFQLQSPQIQYAKNISIFAGSSGTFTPAAGVFRAKGRVWGCGGGGGGMGNAGVGGGGGGGGGGYAEGYFACTPGVGITITIGTAGTGGSAGGNTGGTGGSCSIGALISATGGTGGSGFTSGTGGGGSGGNGSGAGTATVPGTSGQSGVPVGASYLGGSGGGTFCVSNSFNTGPGAGSIGNFPGGGGSGSNQNAAGGTGGGGLVLIEW